jgi:hypothetical protein
VNELAGTGQSPNMNTVFAALLREVAQEDAPQLFAIVEEYGEQADARVAGYGLAYDDHVDVNSVEGDFRLNSQSPESALSLFEVSTADKEVKRLHLVWLDRSTG